MSNYNGTGNPMDPHLLTSQGDSFMRKAPGFLISDELKERFFNAQKSNADNAMKKIKGEVVQSCQKMLNILKILLALAAILFFTAPFRIMSIDPFSNSTVFAFNIGLTVLAFILFVVVMIGSSFLSGMVRNIDKCLLTKEEKENLDKNVSASLTADQQYHLYQKLSKSFVTCEYCGVTNELSERECKSCGAKL